MMTTDAKNLRVLLLAPQFWTSGTVTLARQLRDGWPKTWRRPTIACPTKSGRPSSRWGRTADGMRRADSTQWQPDVTGSPNEIISIARDLFDVVYVTEPDMPGAHRWWWHDLLAQLPIPWALVLNGNTYPDVNWDIILGSRNFTGVVWCTPGHIPDQLLSWSPRVGNPTLMRLPRPYTLKYPVGTQLPRVPHTVPEYACDDMMVVGTHCRVAPDKGVALVSALAKHVRVNVCVDGVPQGGAMPYTLMMQQRYVSPERRVTAETPWMTTPDDRREHELVGRLRYNGAFTDSVETARHHHIHVSATRLGFSAGHEYALLEAIDAGCVIVQPIHMMELDCRLHQFVYSWQSRGVVGALTREHTDLSQTVRLATRFIPNYDQSRNRALIAQHHNPERLAEIFTLEVLRKL